MTSLYVGTDDGVWLWREGQATPAGLQGKKVGQIAWQADDACVLHAAIRYDGVYRTDDAGAHWTRVLAGDVWTLIHRLDRCEFVYAGMEPAGVYRSSDYGRSWVELDSIYRLPTYKQWWFPPPPHIAHVTSFAAHPHDVKTLYAGVEIGGVIVTHDGGRTWAEQHEGLHADVHALTCSGAPLVLYAATADGFHRSTDLGESWRKYVEGMDRWYGYAILCVGGDTERLLLAASPGFDAGDSLLYRSDDGGEHWQSAMVGMPAGQIDGRMKLANDFSSPGACLVGLPDGRIMHSANGGASWQAFAQGLPHINSLIPFRTHP